MRGESTTKAIKNRYDLGDIVFVNEFTYENKQQGSNHLFVVVADDDRVLPLEYFGLIVSSHREKSKENSNLRYNEPLDKNTKNALKQDSIVKCDQLYTFPKANIQFKIGSVDVDDFIRFIQAYETYLEETEKETIGNR